MAPISNRAISSKYLPLLLPLKGTSICRDHLGIRHQRCGTRAQDVERIDGMIGKTEKPRPMP
jgi:hypothetical protein